VLLELTDCRLSSCAGPLQILPFCSDETLDQLEQNLMSMPSMTQLLNQGLSPQQITDKILAGLGSSSSADTIQPR
jgi:molecular chaperone Hsp33